MIEAPLYVVASTEGDADDETGEPLFWSNAHGWGYLSTATVFTADEAERFSPPIGGTFIELP